MPESDRRQQREVHYLGHVQGVGFRYTAYRIAPRFAVTGYVRNLPDGRVHLVAEGVPEDLDGFLAAIRGQFQGYIVDESQDVRPASGSFGGFDIHP